MKPALKIVPSPNLDDHIYPTFWNRNQNVEIASLKWIILLILRGTIIEPSLVRIVPYPIWPSVVFLRFDVYKCEWEIDIPSTRSGENHEMIPVVRIVIRVFSGNDATARPSSVTKVVGLRTLPGIKILSFRLWRNFSAKRDADPLPSVLMFVSVNKMMTPETVKSAIRSICCWRDRPKGIDLVMNS